MMASSTIHRTLFRHDLFSVRSPRRGAARICVRRSKISSMNMAPAGTPPVAYDDAVTPAELDEWERELSAVIERIRPLFYRVESQRHAGQYLRGLLSPLARKNGWTIAEHVGEPEPTALQRLLNLSPWDAEALLAVNREYAMENLADPGAILVADPTGFAKRAASQSVCSDSTRARWVGSTTARSRPSWRT